MDQEFLDKMKEKLLEQRRTLLQSLSEQSEDMRNLVKTVDSGDEADVASDVIDRQLLNSLGTDPTADSLHLGHYSSLCMAKRLANAGKHPVLLCGGAHPDPARVSQASGLPCLSHLRLPEHSDDLLRRKLFLERHAQLRLSCHGTFTHYIL